MNIEYWEKRLEKFIFIDNNKSDLMLYDILINLRKLWGRNLKATDIPFATEYAKKYPMLTEGKIRKVLSMKKCPAKVWEWIKDDNVRLTFAMVSRLTFGYRLHAYEIEEICKIVIGNNLYSEEAYKLYKQKCNNPKDYESQLKDLVGKKEFSQGENCYRFFKDTALKIKLAYSVNIGQVPFTRFRELIDYFKEAKKMANSIYCKLENRYDVERKKRTKKCKKCRKEFLDNSPNKIGLYCRECL